MAGARAASVTPDPRVRGAKGLRNAAERRVLGVSLRTSNVGRLT